MTISSGPYPVISKLFFSQKALRNHWHPAWPYPDHGKVSKAEAESFVAQLRELAKPPDTGADPSVPVTMIRGDRDSISEDALEKIKQAAMGPVDAQVEFVFSRTRYASVFCTRF